MIHGGWLGRLSGVELGGVSGWDGAMVARAGDGTSVALPIQGAEEHLPIDPCSVCRVTSVWTWI